MGRVATDPGQGSFGPVPPGQNYGRGARVAQVRTVPGMRKEAKVARAGALQRGDSQNLGIGIAYQLPAKPGDDFTKPISTRNGLRHLPARVSSSALMTLSVM